MSAALGETRAVYEIQVEGELDESWEEWFSPLEVTVECPGGRPPISRLAGPVADQAALRGMLSRLWDLNLTVVSVRRVQGEEQGG